MSVTMNLKVNDYTSKVLGVIKEKYALKDKAQALNKFAEMYGEDYAEKEVKEEIIKEIIDSCNKHIKKHGHKTRTIKEIRKKIEG